MTIVPQNAVLCGKGRGNEHRSGNKRYNKLIKENCKRYRQASGVERTDIVQQIRGEFNHFVSLEGDGMEFIDERRIVSKIKQALTDAKRNKRKRKVHSSSTISTSSSSSVSAPLEVAAARHSIPRTVYVASTKDDPPQRILGQDDVKVDELTPMETAVISETRGGGPRKQDIIFSRGRRFHSHPGNLRFRSIILATSKRITREEYDTFELDRKQELLEDIYLSLTSSNNGARFYKLSHIGEYECLNQRDARARIGQALRDCYRRAKANCRPSQVSPVCHDCLPPSETITTRELRMENGLCDADLPMGRGAPCDHSKRQHLTRLIDQNAPEYARAPKLEGFHNQALDRFIRSKHTIITAVVQELMADGGRFMSKENGVWVEKVGFNSETKEVRVLVQERFNRVIKSWKGNLRPLPQLDDQAELVKADEEVHGVTLAAHPLDSSVLPEGDRSVGSSEFSFVLTGADMSLDSRSMTIEDAIADVDINVTINETKKRKPALLYAITSMIASVSISSVSIGTFSASKESIQMLRRTDDMRDGWEVTTIQSLSVSTIHSMEPLTNKLRFSSSDPVFISEAKESISAEGSVAPDLPVGITVDGLSLLNDELSFMGDNRPMGAKGDLAEEWQPSHKPVDTQGWVPSAKSKQSVALTNLEIVVRSGDASVTSPHAGLESLGWVFVDRMIFQLAEVSLNVNDTKGLLDDLLDLVINEDRRLMDTHVADEAVRVVSTVMERYVKDPSVLLKVFVFVGHLYGNMMVPIQVSDDFVTQTVGVLRSYHTDVSILSRGWWLLRVLTVYDATAKVVITNVDGIAWILNGMCQYSNYADIQQEGCELLGQLAYRNPDNQQAIVKSNGIEVILQTMRQHEECAEIQGSGCFALGQLTFRNPDAQHAIADANGIHAIFEAMRQHEEYAEVQKWGSYALRHLTYKNLEGQRAIADANGIDARLNEQHPEGQELDRDALRQLIVADPNTQRVVEDDNAVNAIVQVTRQYERRAVIHHKERCSWGLLASKYPENQYRGQSSGMGCFGTSVSSEATGPLRRLSVASNGWKH